MGLRDDSDDGTSPTAEPFGFGYDLRRRDSVYVLSVITSL